jgi:thiol:disulfide interchange protein
MSLFRALSVPVGAYSRNISMTAFARERALRLPLIVGANARVLRVVWLGLISAALLLAGAASIAEPAASSAAKTAVSPLPTPPPAPLPVDVAFPAVVYLDKASPGTVRLKIDVQPGHYLYRDRFEFARDGERAYALDKFKQPADAQAKVKDDPNFGKVKVFEVPVTLTIAQNVRGASKITVMYQGCSELAGVCYPPTKRTFDVKTAGVEVAANEAVKPSLGSLFKKNVSQ